MSDLTAKCPCLTYAHQRKGNGRWDWPGDPKDGSPILFPLVRCNYDGTAEQIAVHRIVTHRLPRWSALSARLVMAKEREPWFSR